MAKYFPLTPGNSWTYLINKSSDISVVVLEGKETVQGIETSVLQYSDGSRDYYTNDSEGIRLHRQFAPNVFIEGAGVVDLTLTFIPPLKYADAVMQSGSTVISRGIVRTNSLPNYGVLEMGYSANLWFEPQLYNIKVPAGTYRAVAIDGEVTIEGSGYTWEEVYLVKDKGIVKHFFGGTNRSVTLALKATNIGVSLNLLSPLGGETIPSGSDYPVKWQASSDITKVRLSFSTDSGLTWKPMHEGFVKGSYFDWKVPTPQKNKLQCSIRISGYNAAGVKVATVQSTAFFAIETLKITSPIAGDRVSANGTLSINWSTNVTKRPVSYIKLLYSVDNGLTWYLITKTGHGTGDSGNYVWNPVQVVIDPPGECRIKLVLKDAGGKTIGVGISEQFTVE